MISLPRAAATAVAALVVVLLVFASPAAAGPDRKAPTTPGNFRLTGVTAYLAHLALSVAGTGATHVSLSWTASVEDGPYPVNYTLYVDGSPIDVGAVTSYAVEELSPQTTHAFRVDARDFHGNASPSSNSVTATTSAMDPNDTTPPTMPGNLGTGGMVFQDGETWLSWIASTDDNTPASGIVYRVIVNGVLDHELLGQTRTILYVPVGQTSRIEVVAVDAAGNESPPATICVTP